MLEGPGLGSGLYFLARDYRDLSGSSIVDFGMAVCENPRQSYASGVGAGDHDIREKASEGRGPDRSTDHARGDRLKPVALVLAVALALAAGVTDWRSRRIPNWLTVSGLIVGLAANTAYGGWPGLKTSLLGAGLGLLVLLPFVLLRSLGAGDWKLAGALGALVGPGVLADLLVGSVFVAGIMALALVIYKRRLMETLRNIGRLLGSMAALRMPGVEVSLDNPQSLKIPYGVALALTTVLYGILNFKMWGIR
jgi:prepilin peptidase CpaA